MGNKESRGPQAGPVTPQSRSSCLCRLVLTFFRHARSESPGTNIPVCRSHLNNTKSHSSRQTSFSPTGSIRPNSPSVSRIYIQRNEQGSLGFMFSSTKRPYNLSQGMVHYISVVDAGGTAQRAGLRVGHRIIQVNEISVASLTHQQVSPHDVTLTFQPTTAHLGCCAAAEASSSAAAQAGRLAANRRNQNVSPLPEAQAGREQAQCCAAGMHLSLCCLLSAFLSL